MTQSLGAGVWEVNRTVERDKLFEVIARDGWWVLIQFPLLFLAYLLPELFGREPVTGIGYVIKLTGAGLLVVAVPFIFFGFVALGRYLTPFPRPLEKSHLQDSGVYGVVRHPIYSGIIIAAAGWSLLSLSWPGLAFSVLLGLFFDRKAAYEEYWLTRKFAAYPEYQKRVKKLIPWVY